MKQRVKPSAEERGDRGWTLSDDECACIHLLRYLMAKTKVGRGTLSNATGVGYLYIRRIVNFDVPRLSYPTIWKLLLYFGVVLLKNENGEYMITSLKNMQDRGLSLRSDKYDS